MTVAVQRLDSGAQKAEQADGHIDVHEDLAARFAGADGEKAADAQRQAEPGGNQRRGMDAAGAEDSRQAQEQSAEPPKTIVTFAMPTSIAPHGKDNSCTARSSGFGVQWFTVASERWMLEPKLANYHD